MPNSRLATVLLFAYPAGVKRPLLLFLILSLAFSLVARTTVAESSKTNAVTFTPDDLETLAKLFDTLSAREQKAAIEVLCQAAKGQTNATSWLRKAAELDCAEAQAQLGAIYFLGEGVERNSELGISWIRKAAEQGNAEGQLSLGLAYDIGVGVERDENAGVSWVRKAANQGHTRALLTMGHICRNRALKLAKLSLSNSGTNAMGQAKDQERYRNEAKEWYRKAAEKGDFEAQYCLGDLLSANDPAAAAIYYHQAAGQGFVEAQYVLGKLYSTGKGVTNDFSSAAHWYRKAAEQGHRYAQTEIGHCYSLGKGVSQDSKEAIKWYRRAGRDDLVSDEELKLRIPEAENGDPSLQVRIGLLYVGGEVVDGDDKIAARWFQKAAEQGDEAGKVHLGMFYSEGRGVEQNSEEAIRWFKKVTNRDFSNLLVEKEEIAICRRAAEKGDLEAQLKLGKGYAYGGKATERNLDEARKWFLKAAEQGGADVYCTIGTTFYYTSNYTEAIDWLLKAAEFGNSDAQRKLGDCYRTGSGTTKNFFAAYKWYLLAAGSGDEIARRELEKLETQIPPSQIALAQQWAADFKPRNPVKDVGKEPTESTPNASGTGFFITENGFLITNHHVVEKAGKIQVLTYSGVREAKLVKVDPSNDLAVLKVEGKHSFLPIVSSRSVKLGETAATVGFPNIGLQGFSPKMAKGEIASLAGAHDDPRHFQISNPLQPGNSGGALIDMRGNVIGVVVGKLSQEAALVSSGQLAENVNYAVKSSFLLSFLEALPEVAAKLVEPNKSDLQFEDAVKAAEQSAVLILVY